MPVIPALGRLKKKNLKFEALGLHNKTLFLKSKPKQRKNKTSCS
jgi:hypothetical protein